MKLYLFDDVVARKWQPFALTRPAGEMLFGTCTLRARAERHFGIACAGHITAAHLTGFSEPGAAPVVELHSIPTDEPRVFVNARAALPLRTRTYDARQAATLTSDGALVARVVPAGSPNPDVAWFDEPEVSGRDVAVDATVLERPWDLVLSNAAQVRADCAALPAAAEPDVRADMIGYKPGLLRTGRDVTIEPHVVFDFTHGPIWLDDGVTVRAFTRLAGPSYIGAGSTLLGGPYEAVSIGPVCRVHGELEESVVLGYSNKAHDGFIGHACLGRWVNLGAMTTNSDLKNNYGSIRMWTPDGDVDTGSIKLGCLIGDHVKMGIGSLIGTGTVIGAGSNLFGTEMPPKHVPPFSWGSGTDLTTYDAEKFLAVTATVMGRRKLTLDDGMRGVLQRAWQLGVERS